MKRDYPRLEPVEFGRHLLTTGDLDPVYLALNDCGFDEDQRLRWLVAYAAFYHCGAASWLSEHHGDSFWAAMLTAARNIDPAPTGGRWPRGHERRHFRGGTATTAIAIWADRHPRPEDMFRHIVPHTGMAVSEIMACAQEYYSIGVWLAFKIADLADACLNAQVDQHQLAPFLYDTPRNSLLAMYAARHNTAAVADEDTAIVDTLDWLCYTLGDLGVPHKPGCPIDMFCLETIACKHASHLSGHYPLFNDIDDINHGLAEWAKVSPAATAFATAMPPGRAFALC